MIKVSICIPEYNAQNYIDRNLNSILNQTYPEIEIILYDDAATDNTRARMFEFSQKYPNRVFSYYSDQNQGIGAAKNAALSHASGDYIFFCDCDDYMKENCIEELVREAERSNYPDIVIDGFTRVDSDGKLLYQRHYRNAQEALQQSIPLFAKIFRRDFLMKNEISSPKGVILEDVLYQALIVSHMPSVAFIDNCGYIWVRNMTSASNTRLRGFSQDALKNSFEYLIAAYDQLNARQRKIMIYYVMQFVSWHLLKSGVGVGCTAMIGEYHKAKTYLDQHFPEYRTIDYVSFLRPKGVRPVVRWCVFFLAILIRFNWAPAFLAVYSKLNLSRLWPNL